MFLLNCGERILGIKRLLEREYLVHIHGCNLEVKIFFSLQSYRGHFHYDQYVRETTRIKLKVTFTSVEEQLHIYLSI